LSRKELIKVITQTLEQTLSSRLVNYNAIKMQIAVNEFLSEFVGEGLLTEKKMKELKKDVEEEEIWLEKWYQNLEKLENLLEEEYPPTRISIDSIDGGWETV